MPKINGFEMLEILDHTPEIIFSTAYNEYAIKAFELNAIDYLLKPYSKERFLEALTKTRNRITTGQSITTTTTHLQHIPNQYLDRIVVRDRGNIHVISTENIFLILAQDDYVMIYTPEKKILKQQTMKYYEEHLDPSQFIRVHRSYIVNVTYMEKIEPYDKEGYLLRFKNSNERIKVSRSGYQKLKEALNF
jgi:two-component system LytT family response regulator